MVCSFFGSDERTCKLDMKERKKEGNVNVLMQTCGSSVDATLSVIEGFIAADGNAGRPGWCQKVTQWNDASKTWLKHHMTHPWCMCWGPLPTQSQETVQTQHTLRKKVPKDCTLYLSLVWRPVFLIRATSVYPWWCPVQVTDSFSELRVEQHPSTGVVFETDGTVASPQSGLHFLVLSGACVCLPVGYGSDGQLSLFRLLPGKPPSIWKQKGCSPGSKWNKNCTFHW